MDTPQDTLNSYRYAEESERRYSKIKNDPQFMEMMDLLSILCNKYRISRVIKNMLSDYRFPAEAKHFLTEEHRESVERSRYERTSWEERR